MINERIYRDEARTDVFLDTYVYEPMSEQPEQNHRPSVLIFPGGGYCFCSEREAEPVVNKFAAEGYNCFVLYYSVAEEDVFPRQLSDAAWAISFLRTHCGEYMVDPKRISVIGFSAGGHLAASLGVYFDTVYSGNFGVSNRPDAVMLVYPVITAGLYTSHGGSIENLLGKNPSEELLDTVSLEKHTRPDMPPVFIASSSIDTIVPIENSLMFACALRESGVSCEMHIFSEGDHGFSVSQRITSHGVPGLERIRVSKWVGLATDWLNELFGNNR